MTANEVCLFPEFSLSLRSLRPCERQLLLLFILTGIASAVAEDYGGQVTWMNDERGRQPSQSLLSPSSLLNQPLILFYVLHSVFFVLRSEPFLRSAPYLP